MKVKLENWQLDRLLKKRSILDIAMDVRMAANGSADYYPMLASDIKLLRYLIYHWQPTSWKQAEGVDNAILALLKAVVKEVASVNRDIYMRSLKERWIFPESDQKVDLANLDRTCDL